MLKHIPVGLIALLLAGAMAACLYSQRLYSQGLGGQGLSQPLPNHQGITFRPDAAQVWREAAAMGLSYNEALALSRLRTNAVVPTPLHPRFQSGAGAGMYQPNHAVRQGVPLTPSVPTTTYGSAVTGKPFSNVRPAPTAFERYWPLLLEGREDPKTGVVIWYIP